MSESSYKLSEIEKDVKPGDQRSAKWAKFIELFGPGPACWLSNEDGGTELYIPDYDTVTKGARARRRMAEAEREMGVE